MIGHEGPWREWRAALAGQRMHHGWILAGKRGSGKGGFALQAARELVAQPGRDVPTGDHPDIIVLSHLPKDDKEERKRDDGKAFELKRNITVDQIRAMSQRLNTRPTLGSRRAIIIDPADDLERSAQNALLKSLEEPPAGTFFLLVAHRPGNLLPTIRSRCRMIAFAGLSSDAIDMILQREAPRADAATRAAAIAAGGGSPGVALEFVSLDLGKVHGAMEALADQGDPDLALRGRLLETMGPRPDRKRQLAAIELARAVVMRRMSDTSVANIPALTQAHAKLLVLAGQAPTYNYDPGLLVLEIGGLLASIAVPSSPSHG